MKLEHKQFAFEVKAPKDGSRFDGHGAVFHNIDAHGDVIVPGAFAKGLKRFLERGFVGGLNHNWDEPIGKPDRASEDAMGLAVGGVISDTAHGKDVKVLLADGVVTELSIGYRTTGMKWCETADELKAYWKGYGYSPSEQDLARSQYGARLLTEIDLYEVSPVTIAANDLARITAVKGDAPARLPFDEHLRAALASVEEVCDRAAQLAAKRAEEGRSLPPQRVAALKQMADRLAAAVLACGPRAGAKGIDLAAAALRLEAEALGLLD